MELGTYTDESTTPTTCHISMGNEFSKLITLKNKRNRPSSLNEGNDETLDGKVRVVDELEHFFAERVQQMGRLIVVDQDVCCL